MLREKREDQERGGGGGCGGREREREQIAKMENVLGTVKTTDGRKLKCRETE